MRDGDTGPATRCLGRSGIDVSALGLGGWAIGGPFWSGTNPLGWGEVDDAESIAAVRRALDLGISYFDTADVYGAGHGEHVLGAALGADRARVVVSSKVGNVFDESSRQLLRTSAAPPYLRAACDASLRRLNTDYLDILFLHLGDLGRSEADAVAETFESLRADGKIRWYGWSTDDPERALWWLDAPGYIGVQHELNVVSDAPPMLDVVARHNLASVNRSPLAMGLLGGKFGGGPTLPKDDVRGKSPAWLRWFADGRPNPDLLARIAAVRETLTSGGRTLAQGAIAWNWGRSERAIPIPGFRTVAQVEENAGALAFGPLTGTQMDEIAALLSHQATSLAPE